jgi:ribosomal protein S18 acetylase RimI-like enzyme
VAVQFGTATPDQFPAILAFWLAATEVPSSTDDLDGLTVLWRRDPEALLVATVGTDIVGTLIAAFDGWRGGLYRLAVRPDHRRQGLARELVRRGEARLASLGVRRLSLFAVAAHEAPMGFWPALGYAPDPHELRFTKNLPAAGPG